MITIKSTFDDEGKLGSKKCSGFRVGFNQEIEFKLFGPSSGVHLRTPLVSILARYPKFNNRL